jgi:Protein of unknown function (DUF4012)
MFTTPLFAVAAANRWLIAFSVVAVLVFAADALGRRRAPKAAAPEDAAGASRRARRAPAFAIGSAAVVVAPLLGLAAAGSATDVVVTMAIGAAGVALVEVLRRLIGWTPLVTVAAATVGGIVAVVAGARLGPTGVGVIDVVGAVAVIVAVTFAVGGLGGGVGTLVALGVLAPAAFGGQDAMATVAAALIALAVVSAAVDSESPTARAARLAVGFGVGVGAFALLPVSGTGRPAVTPLVLLGLLLLDALMLVVGRYDRRLPLWEHRPDHLQDRLVARGWSARVSAIVLAVVQGALSVLALFCARAVAPTWFASVVAIVLVAVVAVLAGRARLAPAPARHTRGFVTVVVILLVVAAAVVTVPVGLAANDAYHLMQDGRDNATHGLSAARDGDTAAALTKFRSAADEFGRARDRLDSPLVAGSLAVPVLASNVRAARALADIGTDLANAGTSLTAAVDPDELTVLSGRLPLEAVAKVTPQLEAGTTALTRALGRLESVRDDPNLVGPVRDAVDKVHTQLVRAQREAVHASAAAALAPTLFGGNGDRRYLLVVQNNAESRATGGFIGSYGIITAHDGKLDVSPLLRDATWNNAMRALPNPTLVAPPDYKARYAQFLPATTIQNTNLAPGFPTVAGVLMNLATQNGIGKVDGVMAVDPLGLAALLELTGPVNVDGWPVPITAENIVKVTLNDAYVAFADSPDRADFLGEVAQAAVDQATSENLGKPTEIAKVLGKAAHGGHFVLAFARPDEQRLAEELGVAMQMDPVRSDAIAVTSSNFGGNKIDYYLDRTVNYDVHLTPNNDATTALARGQLGVTLANTAPDSGLPASIIGPFRTGFVAGQNRSWVSLYSPLEFVGNTLDGVKVATSTLVEDGRNVTARFVDIPAKSSKQFNADLVGTVALHGGWYSVDVRHQPTLNSDRVTLAVTVPQGWKIDKTSQMKLVSPQKAEAQLTLQKSITPRVHLVRDDGNANLWQRLQAGS